MITRQIFFLWVYFRLHYNNLFLLRLGLSFCRALLLNIVWLSFSLHQPSLPLFGCKESGCTFSFMSLGLGRFLSGSRGFQLCGWCRLCPRSYKLGFLCFWFWLSVYVASRWYNMWGRGYMFLFNIFRWLIQLLSPICFL